MGNVRSIIASTGSYIPNRIVANADFLQSLFYNPDGTVIDAPIDEIVRKFEELTKIKERRYVDNESLVDLAFFAATNALNGIDPNELDGIIVAHNLGSTIPNRYTTNVAVELKDRLNVKSPGLHTSNIIRGCSGWVKGVIEADEYIKSGANLVLVVGAEIMSQHIDRYDRDSMLFGDGAGGIVLRKTEGTDSGILAYASHKGPVGNRFSFGHSYNPEYRPEEIFLHMNGRAVYKYAVMNVPKIAMEAIRSAGLELKDINKVFMHQANGKMIDEILGAMFKTYENRSPPENVMPETVSWLGNSSVATVPTVLDLVIKGKMPGQELKPGDNILLASIGAAMNIDCVVYRV